MSKPIFLEHSLQAFFFDQLNDLNKKSSQPLPNEMIYYSSLVMDKFGDSSKYFSVGEDGSVNEKILGLKYLEASQKSSSQKKVELKEIGDTALFLCGFFSESVSRKITDISYYQGLGRTAYHQLNNIVPEVFEVPDFYARVSDFFEQLIALMTILTSELSMNKSNDDLLLFTKGIKVS